MPKPLHILNLTLSGGVMALLLIAGPVASADEQQAEATRSSADQPAASGVEIEILDISADTMLSRSFDSVRGLQIRTRIANHTNDPVSLRVDQLVLTCNGQNSGLNPATPDPLLTADRLLQPGEELTGALAFSVISNTAEEPDLQLVWKLDSDTRTWDLNQELRRLLEVRTELIGPENGLAVLTLNDTVDLEMIWVLSSAFTELQAAGIQRVVVVSVGEATSPRRSQITTWLSTARQGSEETRLPFTQQARSPVQFAEFHVAGFGNGSSSRGYRSPTAGEFMHPDREHAVAAALQNSFRRLPVAAALQGLDSQEPGIRRAALSTSIDQLTSKQLQKVIAEARSATSSQQVLVAELLSQVADPGAVDALYDFVMSPDAEVSQAGLSSLVRCLSPKTDRIVDDIWVASAGTEVFRGRIIDEMLSADDDRWTGYVRQHAEVLLSRAAAPLPQSIDLNAALSDPDAGDNPVPAEITVDTTETQSEAPTDPPAAAATPPLTSDDMRRLQRMLNYFQQHDPAAVVQFARARVLKIHIPAVQDQVLDFILSFGDPADAELARQYINQRLPDGAVTDDLIETISQFPDTRYTETLTKLSQQSSLRSLDRNRLLSAAIQCATGRQLDPLLDNFHSLDSSAQTLLLQHLAASNHPRWPAIAESALGRNPSQDGAVLRAISATASPESLSLLLKLMEQVRQQAAAGESFEGSRAVWVKSLLAQVGTYTHPEAKRMLNRCYISPSPTLRSEAGHVMPRALARSPGALDYHRSHEETRQQQYDQALKSVNAAIAKDPFLADALHSRASLHLRANAVQQAIQDLEEANRLNPEDIVAESTLAIARVRTGIVSEALEYAEDILSRVPEQAGTMRMITLYNTACAYARTAEVPGVAASEQQRYLDRAVELFAESIDFGFDEVDHVRNDPDLNSLHERPEWEDLLQRIVDNAEKKQQAQQR